MPVNLNWPVALLLLGPAVVIAGVVVKKALGALQSRAQAPYRHERDRAQRRRAFRGRGRSPDELAAWLGLPTVHTRKKLRVLRPHQRQTVTGRVVNDGVNLPRTTRRRLRAAEHRMKTTGRATHSPQQLAGWRALRQMVATQRWLEPDTPAAHPPEPGGSRP